MVKILIIMSHRIENLPRLKLDNVEEVDAEAADIASKQPMRLGCCVMCVVKTWILGIENEKPVLFQ